MQAEYVVLLNSDVEVTDGWLDTLLSYMRTHARVAAVQPKILSWQSKEDALAKGSNDILFEYDIFSAVPNEAMHIKPKFSTKTAKIAAIIVIGLKICNHRGILITSQISPSLFITRPVISLG